MVKSPMGSGKTEAVKRLLKSADQSLNFAFASPSTKLNRSIAKELGAHFYKDVLKEGNRNQRKIMAQNVVGTLQFFRKILKEFPELRYDVFIMDESQGLARMLISSITYRQEEVLTAAKTIAKGAKKVIAMDAYLGRETEVLMGILLDDVPVTLVNQSTPWQDTTVDILRGQTYNKRKTANDALQIEALVAGKNIVICSSSVTYCQLRYDVLSGIYPDKKIGIITAEESAEAQALIDNPALMRDYDILILSPAVSIGVSFNEKNHMDCCFGVFPNKRGTGDSFQALQIMARLRSLTDNPHAVFTHMPSVPEEIGRALITQLKRNIAYTGLEAQQHDADLQTNQQLIQLFQTCEQIQRDNKNNYNQYFMQELKAMNVTIHYRESHTVTVNKQSEALSKAMKAARKERHQQAKTEGKAIDQRTFEQITLKIQHHAEIVSEDERDSHTASLFRQPFNLEQWELSATEKQHYLHLDAINAVEKCTNRDRLNAPTVFIKKVIAMQLEGIGKNKAFKENIMSKKHNLLLYRKLGYQLKLGQPLNSTAY